MKAVKNLKKIGNQTVRLFASQDFTFKVTSAILPEKHDTTIWLVPFPNQNGYRNYIAMNINWGADSMDVSVSYKGSMRTPKNFSSLKVSIKPAVFQTMQDFINWVEVVIPAVPDIHDALRVVEK